MCYFSSGLDTFTRDTETNEPAEMLVEDTSQSQGFASSVDGSESVEKMVRFDKCVADFQSSFFHGYWMSNLFYRAFNIYVQENACNYMSNSDTIFSPVLNDELNGTDRGICSCYSFSISFPLFDI